MNRESREHRSPCPGIPKAASVAGSGIKGQPFRTVEEVGKALEKQREQLAAERDRIDDQIRRTMMLRLQFSDLRRMEDERRRLSADLQRMQDARERIHDEFARSIAFKERLLDSVRRLGKSG